MQITIIIRIAGTITTITALVETIKVTILETKIIAIATEETTKITIAIVNHQIEIKINLLLMNVEISLINSSNINTNSREMGRIAHRCLVRGPS